MVQRTFVFALMAAIGAMPGAAQSQPSTSAPGAWQFAVSGDSRNCGDVVMPAIAADALSHQVSF